MSRQYVLSISYGKDSLACLGAIEKLQLPLDRIVHAEVWATDTISADFPSMVEFKTKADKIIKDRWGIDVEHYRANATYCRKWCEENDLLSPIYSSSARGGCWFCHNQGIEQLRKLRHEYPDLWALLMKWDLDSPVTFKADGHTVHDYDRRFELEDLNLINNTKFKWEKVENPPLLFLEGESKDK